MVCSIYGFICGKIFLTFLGSFRGKKAFITGSIVLYLQYTISCKFFLRVLVGTNCFLMLGGGWWPLLRFQHDISHTQDDKKSFLFLR